MADTKSTVEVELEKADRFPKSRISYVVWTRQQGKKLRAAAEAEEAPPPVEAPGATVAERFNAV